MSDHDAVRGAGEAPVGDQRDLFAQALPHDRRGHRQHLAHARAARRALATDHHHVAALQLVGEHRRHRRLLAVEHARWP